jgi:hypothetical protein
MADTTRTFPLPLVCNVANSAWLPPEGAAELLGHLLGKRIADNLVAHLQAAGQVLLQRYDWLELPKTANDDSPQPQGTVAAFHLFIAPTEEQIAALVADHGETLELKPFTKAEKALHKSKLTICRSA